MEENEGILSSRAQKDVKKVKETIEKAVGYLKMRSVSGWIRESEYHEWKKYKQRCQDYKIKMSPDGTLHNLRLGNIIDPVFYPIAKASGLETIPFTEKRILKFMEFVKNNKDWINETNRLHEDITRETDKNLLVQIKKK